MRTTKPISTVSFNTEEYLRSVLEEQISSGVISWYVYIKHKGEDDDAGRKDHMHVYAEPSKTIQTDNIRAMFKEFDPENPDKPLGTLLWKVSKFQDWYMYAKHDPVYLANKGLVKKYVYQSTDFVSNEDMELADRISNFPVLPMQRMLEEIQNGTTFEQLVACGFVPIQQIVQYRQAYMSMWQYQQSINRAEEQLQNIERALLVADGFEPVPENKTSFGDI